MIFYMKHTQEKFIFCENLEHKTSLLSGSRDTLFCLIFADFGSFLEILADLATGTY